MSKAPIAPKNNEEFYITWGNDKVSKDKAAKAFSSFIEVTEPIMRTEGHTFTRRSRVHDYSDLTTKTSSRPGLIRSDYEAFRPDEAMPRSFKESIHMADVAYIENGILRNVIDLMSDFGTQGMVISHPNKRIEAFGRNWWKRVNGDERSERFLNYLYRMGNVIVRKQTAKLREDDVKKFFKSHAADLDIEKVDFLNPRRREISMRYVFYDPRVIDVVGGGLSSLAPKPEYVISIPRSLAKLIKNPKTKEERAIVKQLPKEIKQAANKTGSIPLPEDKTEIFFYKKDDWNPWAFPIAHSIMKDLILYNKLKLADSAALDGAISNLRIIKLGSLEHKIVPSAAAATKLSNMLENHTGAGTMDLIWTPDIEMIESKTAVHQFLGAEKYEPTLMALFMGLGIPPTLTGTFGNSGTTNNYISLKTLTQRLQYGRDLLCQFWMKELTILQKAFGFRLPFEIEFDYMNLGDEEAEKAVLLQMADRGLISDELLQRRMGHNVKMENVRTQREHKERENGQRPPKAGAFHEPQMEFALQKIALQSGQSTPSEVGLELKPKKKGEKPALMMKQPPKPPGSPAKKKGQPQQGRPKNSKDSNQRKKKAFKPKVKAVEIWANAAQSVISDTLQDDIVKMYGKKNMRSLSKKETEEAEIVKFGVLCNIPVLSNVDDQMIYEALAKSIPSEMLQLRSEFINGVGKELEKKLTLDECRHIQSYIMEHYYGEV